MRAPIASSTSAEPERPVAERLPCLASAQPAPAAIRAAVVETLKSSARRRCRPCRPGRRDRVSTGMASARIVAARPASSSTVSPFVRSAISTAAIWARDALPAMISASTAAACSCVRSLAGGQRVDGAGEVASQEVLEQGLARVGEHRLGVELHALGGQLAMADRHHDAAAARR